MCSSLPIQNALAGPALSSERCPVAVANNNLVACLSSKLPFWYFLWTRPKVCPPSPRHFLFFGATTEQKRCSTVRRAAVRRFDDELQRGGREQAAAGGRDHRRFSRLRRKQQHAHVSTSFVWIYEHENGSVHSVLVGLLAIPLPPPRLRQCAPPCWKPRVPEHTVGRDLARWLLLLA